MHTDEYEISLAQELKVCESAIRKAKRFLVFMNTKYELETESFIEQYNSGVLGRAGSSMPGRTATRHYWNEKKEGNSMRNCCAR